MQKTANCSRHYAALPLTPIRAGIYKEIQRVQMLKVFRLPAQMLRIMRMLTVFLFAAFLTAHASGISQPVTLSGKDISLKQVFSAIEKQTEYVFFYNEHILSGAKPVSLAVYDIALEDLLFTVFKNQPLEYVIQDKTIILSRKPTPLSQVISYEQPTLTLASLTGRVLDAETKASIGSASISVKGSKVGTYSDASGNFSLSGFSDNAVLVISTVGYSPLEIPHSKMLGLSVGKSLLVGEATIVKVGAGDFTIYLSKAINVLDEFSVKISTGYQNIPKERATGSFTFIDNETLSRTVSPNLGSRLEGVTNGLLTLKGNIQSIRGQSTIHSNTAPLIILDNFPFEGDINTINPEMVESVTILKDAAAASIWGSRSGNGVIVITTKKGVLNQAPRINTKIDFTVGKKADLYYQPQLTSSEFIDIEQFLFSMGKYTGEINTGYSFISPVVAILDKISKNPGYATQGMAEIDALRKIDSREQLNKYFYRNSLQQSYFAGITGGNNIQTYNFSAGYNRGLPNYVALSDSRLTLKANNNYRLLKNRLIVDADIMFSTSVSNNKAGVGNYSPYLPYERVADEAGNALATLKNSSDLRATYTDTVGDGRLLDWKYRPLDELREGYSYKKSALTDYRINLGLNYKIMESLMISLNYLYSSSNGKNESSEGVDSYSARDKINTYSQINWATGQVKTPFPIGDIVNLSLSKEQSNSGRVLLSFNQNFGEKHEVSAIAGYEIGDENAVNNSIFFYGFDAKTATSIDIDRFTQFPNYYTGLKTNIGSRPGQRGTINRNVSIYGNGSYSYDNKYIVSASYRKDESNLFGVKANQKGIPLWSAGFAWNIHQEAFFAVDWLSYLQLKTTYGYNGNVNTTVSAYLTARASQFGDNSFTRTPTLEIVNPPNDDLRWERIKNINTALVFSTKQTRLSGSVEYFVKDGIDLIASSPIAPQVGQMLFTGNTANTHTEGIDIQLNSRNMNGSFKWSTIYIFNYVKDKITDYKTKVGTNGNVISADLAPLVGYPIHSVFAYPWAGLDARGNPLGYLNGAISSDYSKMSNSVDINQLQFFGSKMPTVYGSLRNNFAYRNLEFSFNILYKMGYYFRRGSLQNSYLYNGAYKQIDYEKRWEKPGDELITNVPSLIYQANGSRDGFYGNSAVLIEKGDHIRLQDIQLNYSITKKQVKNLPFVNINIYVYATNLGLIWKRNKQGLDPEVADYPSPTTIAFGVKTNF